MYVFKSHWTCVCVYLVCGVSDQMDSFKLIAAIYNAVYLLSASSIEFSAIEFFKWDNKWLLAIFCTLVALRAENGFSTGFCLLISIPWG